MLNCLSLLLSDLLSVTARKGSSNIQDYSGWIIRLVGFRVSCLGRLKGPRSEGARFEALRRRGAGDGKGVSPSHRGGLGGGTEFLVQIGPF